MHYEENFLKKFVSDIKKTVVPGLTYSKQQECEISDFYTPVTMNITVFRVLLIYSEDGTSYVRNDLADCMTSHP